MPITVTTQGSAPLDRYISAACNAVAAGVAASTSITPAGAIASTAVLEIVKALLPNLAPREKSLGYSAWEIIRTIYAIGISKYISCAELGRKPSNSELKQLISDLLRRAELFVDSTPQQIYIDHLYAPLKLLVLRDAASRLPHELIPFSPQCDAMEIRTTFETCLANAISDTKNAIPNQFIAFEAALTDALTVAEDRRRATSRHQEFLIRHFTQTPIFGQEESGITLADLYIRQRAIWFEEYSEALSADAVDDKNHPSSSRIYRTKKDFKKKRRLHVSDLHQEINGWLYTETAGDSIKVIAGGPGSGKSTLARAIAIETIDRAECDVLYIPLQEIDAAGSFDTRIENLFRERTELGFDRVENPLRWMGQSSTDGSQPDKPLLLICDGLDEIAAPETAEAANLTADFIQNLSNWINSRNSGGLYARAIVLGRTISAEEAFHKLAMDLPALLRVGGLLPLTNLPEWKKFKDANQLKDDASLSEIDQRVIYWNKWCDAHYSERKEVPIALKSDVDSDASIAELTTEPLLLYLLLWTGFVGTRWSEAANNRNVVYEEIFERIYLRDWGAPTPASRSGRNRQRGGHSATRDLSRDDFFLLQETLGLASWPSGGRTVSSESFEESMRAYLDPDAYEEFRADKNLSLKSVALQSYTKNSSDENLGYEFVHKSLGEYLIGRCLISGFHKALTPLAERKTESRAERAALYIATLAHRGALTSEIYRFFLDEVRLRISDARIINIQDPYTFCLNWVLRNYLPIHRNIDFHNRSYSFLRTAEVRALDAFWSFGQSLLSESNPTKNQKMLPMDVDWPSSYSFTSFFKKISDRSHVAETKRIPTFNNIRISSQSVTEESFGSVLFDVTHSGIRPVSWLHASFRGSAFIDAPFYSAILWNADFTLATIKNAVFSSSRTEDIRFNEAELENVQFRACELKSVNFNSSKLINASFNGTTIIEASFTRATLIDVHFGSDISRTNNDVFTRIENSDFRDSTIKSVSFANTSLHGIPFSGALIRDVDFSSASIKNCDFSDVTFNDVKFKKKQLESLKIEMQDGIIEV